MTQTSTLKIATPTEREIVMTRDFKAPRSLVFDAMTRPELIARWYGPVGWSLVVCEIDLRVGGTWHFVSRRPDGKQIGQRGVYREIAPPERIVNTESWDDWNPGEVLVTVVLVEHGGTTTLTNTLRFPTKEVRDMLIKSGMTNGAAEMYDNLAECLASIA